MTAPPASRTALLLLLAVAAWMAFGPAQLGGPSTFLVTSGISMEPGFHAGDLAVVRRAQAYGVGDIVAYRLTPRTVVLHRIVGQEDGHFVMKGDNNTWLDSAHPDPSQVVGSLWLRIPSAGSLLLHLRSPGVLALLVVAVGSITVAQRRRPRTGRERRQTQAVAWSASWSSLIPASRLQDALGLAAIVAAVSLAATVFAFSRPAQRVVSSGIDYQQSGAFTYSGAAPGTIYTDGQVSTGEPVYLQLVRKLDVQFDYRFSAAAPHRIQGSYRLIATVGQDAGWQRSVDLIPETPFEGDHVSMLGSVPLDQVQALVAIFADQTGIKGSTYAVAVQPLVKIQGSLAAAAFTEQFAPPLRFRMDLNQLVLERSPERADPLAPVQMGSAAHQRAEPNRFSLLGLQISVVLARILALAGLVLAGLATAGLTTLALSARQADEPAQIEARYGSLLLRVRPDAAITAGEDHVIDLLQIEDLAKVAAQTGRMILHQADGRVHRYLVTDGASVYRYAIGVDKDSPTADTPRV